ncbi:TIR domain-containing protein [Desulfitobacterium sp. AusDCA]|uniref:TIR domain-containing protein n=1 Tax=Desulfitobacterium sp. AusDCA TaxID=3240383 RepID=UPI003DA6CE9D
MNGLNDNKFRGEKEMAYQGIKRRVFISHYKGDRTEVDDFVQKFAIEEKVFTPYVLGANDNDEFINSANPEYVMTQIRKKYLLDTTVTIVLIGSCTHSRRYIDWELKSSLKQGEYTPNGVMGIILPSKGNSAYLPPRLEDNWSKGHENCYARYWVYPKTAEQLGAWIEDAFNARTSRAHLIKNSQDMMKYNAKCKICGITH